MNPYLNKLNKLEFVITYACTGKCKHCSEGDHDPCGRHIDPQIAAQAVKRIAAVYGIQTVMAFGGEPLLYPDAVCALMTAARAQNVPRCQVITNGYFSKDPDSVRTVVRRLADCGVNDLLLSVDAFHQEHIPLDAVRGFAREAVRAGLPLRLSPAWLVSATHDNPYNRQTKMILEELSDICSFVGEGNVIFPKGNAIRYLADYFTESLPKNPYREDPYNVRCVSFSPNGDVLNGNVYQQDVMEIIKSYKPQPGCG